MKILSLKLREEIFNDVERVVKNCKISRNAYINEALQFYNKLNQRKAMKQKLHKESRAVSESSLRVLKEFERFEEHLPEWK